MKMYESAYVCKIHMKTYYESHGIFSVRVIYAYGRTWGEISVKKQQSDQRIRIDYYRYVG